MKKTLYLECYSGISGDMAVAALLDLGADAQVLAAALKSLPLSGYQIQISRVKKSGIDACDFHVILDQEIKNHDYDMEYLYGHNHSSSSHTMSNQEETCAKKEMHNHNHKQNSHHHELEHEIPSQTHSESIQNSHHQDGGHTHIHRGMREIREIIMQGDLTEGARQLSLKIFEVLAEAESKAHNLPVEQVHFHEVGAVDSIVDIVAFAVCFDNLGIQEVIVPELWEGRGTVRCQHGVLPIPVPAVVNIVQQHGLNIHIMETEGEFITPTGAAIVATVKTSAHLPKHFTIQKIGLGAGKRKTSQSGILRGMWIS